MKKVLSNGFIAMNICKYLNNIDIFNLYKFTTNSIPIYIFEKMNLFDQINESKKQLNFFNKLNENCIICHKSLFSLYENPHKHSHKCNVSYCPFFICESCLSISSQCIGCEKVFCGAHLNNCKRHFYCNICNFAGSSDCMMLKIPENHISCKIFICDSCSTYKCNSCYEMIWCESFEIKCERYKKIYNEDYKTIMISKPCNYMHSGKFLKCNICDNINCVQCMCNCGICLECIKFGEDDYRLNCIKCKVSICIKCSKNLKNDINDVRLLLKEKFDIENIDEYLSSDIICDECANK